jgi:hypothetical protein
MVVVNVIAITIFLWGDATTQKGVVMLTFLWVVSAVAILYIARGLRHHLELLHFGASPGPTSR